ncbi:MAG: hypothetical protein J2P21_26350, partial [Chloracidobacterium sp.]|nr:hypothetical protein [Chloracidobacterium sp.]
MIAQSIFSPSMRARWISAVICAAIIFATVGSSLAFQGPPPVPSTVEEIKAGDVDREPYQN